MTPRFGRILGAGAQLSTALDIKLLHVVVLCLAACCSVAASEDTKFPIILVPGLGGSVLESKLHNVSQPNIVCSTDHDWQVEWVTPQSVALIPCLLNNLVINYNVTTQLYQNQTGVEIRPYNFGGLQGITALDPELPGATGYFAKLIVALGEAGYREGTDLFGAPYDFRLAADGLLQIGWYKRFQNLIEEAVSKQHGMPAVLITHSMGGLVTKYFLDMMARDPREAMTNWSQRHIAGLIAIATPWDGAVSALKGQISGDPFDLPLPHDLLHPVQKTSPSGPWLFPREAVWRTKVLVRTTGGSQYTARDAAKLLDDLGLEQQAIVLSRVSSLIQPLLPLRMPVHCLYGKGIDTDEVYVYDVSHFNNETAPAPIKTTVGDGDGTVNLSSLAACDKLGPRVTQYVLPNATHLGILSDSSVTDLVIKIAYELQYGVSVDNSHRRHESYVWKDISKSDKPSRRLGPNDWSIVLARSAVLA